MIPPVRAKTVERLVRLSPSLVGELDRGCIGVLFLEANIVQALQQPQGLAKTLVSDTTCMYTPLHYPSRH